MAAELFSSMYFRTSIGGARDQDLSCYWLTVWNKTLNQLSYVCTLLIHTLSKRPSVVDNHRIRTFPYISYNYLHCIYPIFHHMYRSRATLYSYWWCYLHDHPTRMYITVTVNWLFQRSNIGLKLFTSPWVMALQKSMQQFSSEKDTTSKRSILVPWTLSYEFEVFLFRLSFSVPSWMIALKMFVVCKRNISTLLIVHCITYYREVASTHGGWIPRWGDYLVVGMSGRVWVLRGWVPGVGMSRGDYSEVSIQGWVCS